MMYIRHHSYNKITSLLCWLSGAKRKALVFLCMLVAVLSIAVACKDNSTSISSSAPYFPVQKAGLDGMTALMEGRLELKNGYLRVHDNLIIWPHGFSLRTEGEEILVIDDNGQVFARVGDKITLGGGGGGELSDETTKEFIEKSITGQPLPDNCTGPYWIVGETVN